MQGVLLAFFGSGISNPLYLLVGGPTCQAARLSGSRVVAGVRVQEERSRQEVMEKVHGRSPCRYLPEQDSEGICDRKIGGMRLSTTKELLV